LLELFTKFVETGAITAGITKFEKLVIALMRVGDLECVLDRAPILLCPAADFPDVSDDAVGVTAIRAVQRLDPVQIGEMPAVEYDVLGATDAGYPVDAEAYLLVEAGPAIEQK